MHGPLAQSVEQKTFNLLVDGSNPSRPTNAFKEETPLGVFFLLRNPPYRPLAGQPHAPAWWWILPSLHTHTTS